MEHREVKVIDRHTTGKQSWVLSEKIIRTVRLFGTGKAVMARTVLKIKRWQETGGIHWIGNEEGWASNETWAKINLGEDYETLPKSDNAYIGVSEGVQWSVPEVDTKCWQDGSGEIQRETARQNQKKSLQIFISVPLDGCNFTYESLSK